MIHNVRFAACANPASVELWRCVFATFWYLLPVTPRSSQDSVSLLILANLHILIVAVSCDMLKQQGRMVRWAFFVTYQNSSFPSVIHKDSCYIKPCIMVHRETVWSCSWNCLKLQQTTRHQQPTAIHTNNHRHQQPTRTTTTTTTTTPFESAMEELLRASILQGSWFLIHLFCDVETG